MFLLLILNIFHAFLLVFLLVTLNKLMLAGKLDLKMFKPLCNISKMLGKPQEEVADGYHNIFCGITKRFQKALSPVFNVVLVFFIVNLEHV